MVAFLVFTYIVGAIFHDYEIGNQFSTRWGRILCAAAWPFSALLYVVFDKYAG